MGKTSIEWTDHSWPVVNGCRRVSEGCTNCYAERLTATRLSKTPKYQGLAVMGKNGPRWTGETRLWLPHLALPIRIRKPSRIFVADMGDLFYEAVSDEDIVAVFLVMLACPQHTFQVLTKRPERARAWLASVGRNGNFDGKARQWPPPNVWLGVSVEDQATADERIPLLLQTPAAVRFVSYEPALEAVDFHWLRKGPRPGDGIIPGGPLHWVIVGGESGPRARPFDIGWARSTVRQCDEAGVACFVKQLGARPFERRRCDAPACNCGGDHDYPLSLADRKGGDMEEWPDDLRVRQFPRPRSTP